MTYRNTKSGAVIVSESAVTGELWEEIPTAPAPKAVKDIQATDKGTEPKEKKRRRKE